MGGRIDDLQPDYNKETNKINRRKDAMIKRIRQLILELNTEDEKALVFWRNDFLEEYGVLIRKAVDYRRSVIDKDYLKDVPDWKTSKRNDALE